MSHAMDGRYHPDGDGVPTQDKHSKKPMKLAAQLPKYQLLLVSSAQAGALDGNSSTAVAQLETALSGCDPSLLLLLSSGHSMGLRFWQDVSDPQRIMFDATQFNQLAGYTHSKGIKGDFLARLKRKIEEHMPASESRSDI